MTLFIDTSLYEKQLRWQYRHTWLQQWIDFANANAACDLVFVGNSDGRLKSLPANVRAITMQPGFFDGFRKNNGFTHGVKKAMQGTAAPVWVTRCPAHVLSGAYRQLLFVEDLDWLQYPHWYERKHWNKNVMGRALQKAGGIITPYAHYQALLTDTFGINAARITVVPPAALPGAEPLNWTNAAAIKVLYSGGKDYFVFAGDLHPKHALINVLKAFSVFKKWQQSGLQLVITGERWHDDRELEEKLDTYKYKADVHIYTELSASENIDIISAAYACVHPCIAESTAFTVVNAFQCEVPVITSPTPVTRELAGDAALYAAATDVAALAQHMILLYKDESKRSQCIALGKAQIAGYNRGIALDKIMAAVMNMQQAG